MFQYLRFRWALHQLEREQRAEEKATTAQLAEAKKRNAKPDEIYEIEGSGASAYYHFQDEIIKVHSNYLSAKARRLMLPVPLLDDQTMWKCAGESRRHLTEQGINHLRALIRAERKARLELFLMWMPGIVAIIGALIGLVSVLKK